MTGPTESAARDARTATKMILLMISPPSCSRLDTNCRRPPRLEAVAACLEHAAACFVDEVHVAQVREQLGGLTGLQAGEGIGARADLRAVQCEEDERLHAQRLDHFDRDVERALPGRGGRSHGGHMLRAPAA